MLSSAEMEPCPAMIVCSCNVISDRDVRACVKPCGASAEGARDVFRCLGVSPKCGRCVRNIQALFERETRAGAPAPEARLLGRVQAAEAMRLRMVQAAE
jgi:bacterioferritin-associated ferredoxin